MNKLAAPESIFRYWGKAKKDTQEEGADYHLLPYHCLDVAAVADVWLQASNTLTQQIALQLGVSTDLAKRIVLFYVLLHDLGKFDARFQNFREDIRQLLQGSEWEIEPDIAYYSHGSAGYKQFCEVYGINEAMKAVAGHHGFCDTSFNYYDPDADDEIIELDAKARREWIEFCLGFCDLDKIPETRDMPMLAGLCSVADWVGSSITNFTTRADLDLCQYYQEALTRAKEALHATGMIDGIQGAGFQYLFPDYQPRGIQTLLPNMPVKAGLTLVESDTGSGKTEFALAYASLLIQAGLADGIVFGLPTQATANGLFSRIGEASEKLFPDACPTLAHGKSRFIVTDESGFLQKSNKRAFLGTMSVATIDQILMGVLSVRHQFVRSFGTRKAVLILDEIHSFDAYMMGLIDQVLKGQHQAFSSAILLSATLPDELKVKLLSSFKGQSLSQDYPLISHTDLSGETMEFSVPETQQVRQKKEVKSELWQSDSLLPDAAQLFQIKKWVADGAMVGVICNTVADAQRLFYQLTLAGADFPIDLFHARYTFADRERIERWVLEKYGKHAQRAGRLLIATQVIEQSLDLDFDILVSQIAPIEYLMQRMGRLWRHDRKGTTLYTRTKTVKEPLFVTLVPNEAITQDCSTKKIKEHYKGSGFVYQNTRWLYRTEAYLRDKNKLVFPDCYRHAIHYIHHPDAYLAEPEGLTDISNAFELKGEGSEFAARQISALQSKPLNDVDPRCALLTRDGEMSVSVVLFKENGELLHGGDFAEQQDRERSLVSLAPKHAKGAKCEQYFCYKAVMGRDIAYGDMGVIYEDVAKEFNTGR